MNKKKELINFKDNREKIDRGTIRAVIEVDKVRVHNEDTHFSVFQAKFIEYDGKYAESKTPIIVGNFPVLYSGDEFIVQGHWVYDSIFGFQFKVVQSKRDVSRTEKSVITFLKNHIKGVGEKTAKRIVKELGITAISRIKENNQHLLSVKGINLTRAEQIQKDLLEHEHFESVSMFILSNGGNYEMALWVYEEFGSLGIKKIRDNPYLLVRVDTILERLSLLKTAEQFAINLELPKVSTNRLEAVIITLFNLNMENNGDVYVPKNTLKEKVAFFLTKNNILNLTDEEKKETLELFEDCIVNLINQKVFVQHTIKDDEVLYSPRFLFYEDSIVDELSRIVAEKNVLAHSTEVDSYIEEKEKTGFKLAKKQKEAIYKAAEGGVSILTGGPGTGKTQTINSILECILGVNKNLEVLLLAPTGRAAKRMNELTDLPSKTIHRAVGYGSSHSRIMELEADFIIVDEMSMSDIYITYRLTKLIRTGASILFVGDVDQLPSVGPGLIFRDFIESNVFNTTILDEVFRQSEDSFIATNSHLVKDGYKIGKAIVVDNSLENTDFYFIQEDDDLRIEQLIIQSIKRFNKLGYSLEDIKVLSPLNIGTLGTWRLNNVLQSIFNPLTHHHTYEVVLEDTTKLRVDDFVLQKKNNKELDVMNGDVGKIESISKNPELGLVIDVLYDDDKTVTYTMEEAEELALGYATSIYKSQGSEYPIVIMPISPSLENYYNRNLIYTGWTRAKKILVTIGSIESANAAIDKIEQTRRYSQVKDKIRRKWGYADE